VPVFVTPFATPFAYTDRVKYLTDFADQALILPLVLAIAVALAVQGWRRGALTWLIVVTGTFAATPMDVHSPSGHVAAATVVTGGLAALLTRHRTTILPAALLAAVVIGVSRLILGAHTLPEVIVGALIGLAGAATLLRVAGTPPPTLRIVPLIAVIVVVAALFHGLHLPAEAAIRHTAFRVTQFIPACRGTPILQRLLAS
jgi:membrane-associated phospholipid phosphatase